MRFFGRDTMGRMTHERAIDLCKGDYGKETLKQVADYVAPIFWVARDECAELQFSNGSIFFVDAGSGIFAVTANHVYEEFVRAGEEAAEIRSAIVPNCFGAPGRETVPFPLCDRLIDRDAENDIATFNVLPEEMDKIGNTVLTTWPPMAPQEGLGVAMAGFPGHDRKIVSLHEISFAVYPVLATAKTVGERLISCQFERDYVVETPGFAVPPPNYSTGGMSGGPLLTLIDLDGFVFWRLGGVIREGSNDMEIIFSSRAECLLPDGKLAR